jgi:hypothetical protein
MTPQRPAIAATRVPLRFIGALAGAYAAALAAVVVATVLDSNSRLIFWPVVATVASVAALVWSIRTSDRSASYFEIGVVYAGIVALYAAVPPVVAALSGFEFSPVRDGRFVVAQPLPSEIASIAWWYAIYLAAFCFTYVLARPRESVRAKPLMPAGRAVPIAAVMLLAMVKLFDVVLIWAFNLHPQSYGEQYLLIGELPMFWRQIANVLDGMEITLEIIILAALVFNYRKTKWLIVLFVGALVALTVLRRGARTEMAIVVIAAMQLRDLLVKRVSARTMAVAAAAGFVAFLAMAVLRQESEGFQLPTVAQLSALGTDFEGIFNNVWDLKYVQGASGAFRGHPSLLLSGITGLIPQQLLPFQKTAPSIWYMQTYYPIDYARGGGLVFGVVAEAVVGYGVIELLLRGAFVGLLLGCVHRHYVKGRVGVFYLAFYVWMTVMAYQTCRNTTLSLVSQTLYRFVPAVLATLLLAAVLRRGRALHKRLFA